MSIALKPWKAKIEYPETDGQPMAENTLQFRWIVTIKENVEAMYAAIEDVFVAGDLFWYPVEGQPGIRVAPDVLAVFGRPKGDRRSYLQWEEGCIAPQVVFEILSPGNRAVEMTRKFSFYEQYGVEEYYIYDPDANELTGWIRDSDKLKEIARLKGWISPRLQVRFEPGEETLEIYGPDGQRFLTFGELMEKARHAEKEKDEAVRHARQQNEELERLRERLKKLENPDQ